MIRMPHRNVTRFFIPLIDVLILLFCIFLLMDFNANEKVEEQLGTVADQEEEIQKLDSSRRQLVKELHEFEALRPKLLEVADLLKRIKELESANLQNVQQRSFFRIVDIDRTNGNISFYDETRSDQPIIKLTDASSAQALIERHAKEAKGRELYYYFQRSRPSDADRKIGKLGTNPTKADIRRYAKWFPTDKVANNLSEFN